MPTKKGLGKPNPRRPKPNVRGEQSREAILKVAERYFGDYGYRGTSTAAIANEVGISDPGLLHHFGSKEGLLTGLLNRHYSRDVEKLHAGEKLDGHGLANTLEAIVRENVLRRNDVRLTMVLLAESISQSHPGHEYFRLRYIRAQSIFTRHFKSLQASGELSPELDSSALANVMLAVLDGLQLQWLLDAQIDMQEGIRAFNSILLAALRPPSAPTPSSKVDKTDKSR